MDRLFADLSSNNGAGALNAPVYAKNHVLLAVKATQGTGYTNPDWAGQVQAAHAHHIPVLHYHYATPGFAADQAGYFLNAIRPHLHKFDAIALDIERGGGVPDPSGFTATFDSTCILRGHRNLIVYTEMSYHQEHGLKPRNGRMWIADYGVGTRGFWAQQFTDSGQLAGINGPTDVSRLSAGAYLYHRTHKP